MPPSPPRRPAVVLSCRGGEETALNVTRSLGRHGVPVIVVSEDAERPAAAVSRYCLEHVVAAPFSTQPQVLDQVLRQIGRKHGPGVPVFPTADPDLAALNGLDTQALRPEVITTLGDPALIERLMDKQSFAALAAAEGLPVPPSWQPATRDQARALAATAQFPLIVKPAFPFNWAPGLARVFSGRKAIIVADAAALLALVDQLDSDPRGLGILVQQYLDGADDQHYDVHAYVDAAGIAQATFTGRKWRIYPPHAGSGAYIEAVCEPALERATAEMLARLGFRGIANVNYKRDPRTGQFWLIEINARVSQWSGFPANLGVNLPWLAYCDAVRAHPGEQRARVWGGFFVDLYGDLRAARIYAREGQWSWLAYLVSLLRARHSQVFDVRDLRPWCRLTAKRVQRLLA